MVVRVTDIVVDIGRFATSREMASAGLRLCAQAAAAYCHIARRYAAH